MAEREGSGGGRVPLVLPVPPVLPVLPLLSSVVFPTVTASFDVGQERSLTLIRDVMAGKRLVAVFAQRSTERPAMELDELRTIGTMAIIQTATRTADGRLHVALRGLERIGLAELIERDPYLVGRVEPRPEPIVAGAEVEALTRAARELFARFVALSPELPDQLAVAAGMISDAPTVSYLVASSLPLPSADAQELLELDSVVTRLRRLVEILQHEIQVREILQEISAETSAELSKDQREQILRRQMEAIQRQLGEDDPAASDVRELRERTASLPLSEEARKEVDRELDRLQRIPSASPEYGMVRTYLDWVLKLPWNKTTGASIDIAHARTVLDQDHYDLDPIKDRILEYLAVKRLREERGVLATGPGDETRREPILCLVGPPGVGKTSLGQSIARALDRRFVRLSLGGIHDEAEIRGHRRTYIGALPGRIVQSLSRAEAADPVFMLDEVDKLGVGFHGDPAAALLEVLDPAQNHAFVDTYLALPFDLSRVLFVCTANTAETIPAPLLDRMEVLSLSGYTDREKLFIAVRYLVPRQRRAHGLRDEEVTIDEAALMVLVRQYTREAGVRSLEREVASLLRKSARRIAEGAPTPIHIGADAVPELLGPPRIHQEVAERIDRPGVATGLAWTPVGGDILFVEASIMPADREGLVLTGMLGDVMRESAQAALSYLRSNSERLGLDPKTFVRKLVHVHVPAGAIPKDGPSAGVTMLTALASHALGRPVRPDLAMTGEITLRGQVLPVGGIKEKALAAQRIGLSRVLIPRRNQSVLQEIPAEVRAVVDFVLVDSAEEVLAAALDLPRAAAEASASAPLH
jgi:ATP-dependent Lon protease